MPGAQAGFLERFWNAQAEGYLGKLSHHRACGPSALQLQARSPRGWHHFGPNVPDGHQNGLIWGPLIPWNPVNALQSWRRLCDPNGSVRVSFILEQKYGRQLSWDRATTIVLFIQESKANEIIK